MKTTRKLALPIALIATFLPTTLFAQFTTLQPEKFHHYATQFAAEELDATGKQPADQWPWLQANIPFFESSDKAFEEIYYFRWYAFQKHIVHSEKYGYLITEWLPKPESTDGAYGVLPDATPFHLAEARWLRTPQIAADYARYWLTPEADPWKYSEPLADAIYQVTLATGDPALGRDNLPAILKYSQHWDDTQRDPNGLFWSIDTRDAMEKSVSGDGYRPTLNSYMVADAHAIAALTTDPTLRAQYTRKADLLRNLIVEKLWNPHDQFYEVVSPSSDSGIRKQKKFIDPGTQLQFANVREEIGYIPWAYDIATPQQDIAWKQLFDPAGFDGKFGPTTCEKRSPRFRFQSSDQCTWNGPMWPFATTQTLNALAQLLNTRAAASIDSTGYYKLFSRYVLAQHLTLPSGKSIPWIDEDRDADKDDWIAKRMLAEKHKQVGRGNYYNHSGFADPLITGLIGLRPSSNNTIRIHPLLPANTWTYFALDALPYHGHLLTILYDQTGTRYNKGRGLILFVDGKKAASRTTLGPLTATLPNPTGATR